MTILSFDCGWGLPTLICVLLLALKFMEGSLFHFPFCSGDVLRVASTTPTSLARSLGDFSLCYPISRLPVESLVLTVFCLPIETVFTILSCLARVPSLLILLWFPWVCPHLLGLFWSPLLYSAIVSLGVCAVVSSSILGSTICPFPLFLFVISVLECSMFLHHWFSHLLQCVLPLWILMAWWECSFYVLIRKGNAQENNSQSLK